MVDTWSGAPQVATRNALALTGLVERYALISTISVYRWGEHVDESSPVVTGDSGSEDESDYAAAKRGTELGILAAFPSALLCRPGLILGPHEDIGRLPWWLTRIAAGGRVVAPGDPDRRLQYIDARDLASFTLDALAQGRHGAVDVISRSGHATMGTLLTACRSATGSDAELVWISESDLAAAGVEPWTQLPCWVPSGSEFAGFLESDTSAAAAAGLDCRPVENTVADTWAWLAQEGAAAPRPGRTVIGLPRDLEGRLLAAHPPTHLPTAER